MNWNLNNLAPVCVVPTCKKYRTRHLLDHQLEIATQILTGNENYIYWQGGVGSAKTLLWGVLAAAYMIMIPGVRIILCRRDYSLLYDTLWRYFKESIKAANEQGIIGGNFAKYWRGRSLKATSYCELPNGSWARAIQLKSWIEAMGPNYDGIFISDAMENNNFGEIFHGGGVVGGLQSRLRGQAASFCTFGDGSIKDMRRFLIESNPPPNINELHTIFGKEPGVRAFPNTIITYRHIQSTSLQNDHNPASYVAEIASMHSDPSDIQRILEGKSIPFYGGVRVIPKFHSEIHVSQFEVAEDLPLFVSIDPGMQHPGVVFSQIKRCAFDKEHYVRLSEISNLFDKTTYELVEADSQDMLGILAHLGLYYPSHFDYALYKQVRDSLIAGAEQNDHIDYTILEQHFSKIRFCIDKASLQRKSSNKDRETDKTVLLKKYGIRCKHRSNIGLEKSLERVNQTFSEICLCNIPIQLVDKKCSLLIDGYSGGYRFTKNKDGSHSDKPISDHLYEDICDADRYGLENFFFITTPEIEEEKKELDLSDSQYQWMYRERY